MRALMTATLCTLALFAPQTQAAPMLWRVNAAQSVISFDYAANDIPASGAFTQVSGEGRFDPDNLAATRFELLIDVGSLDLGDPIESAFALSAEWFDAANHPVARYRLAALTALGDGRFEALGDLTIKGRLKVLRTPITLAISDDRATASGELAFDRRDFDVGAGPSSLFISVGNAVSVRFTLVAEAARLGNAL